MDTPQLKLDNQICFRLYTASRLITQAYEPYFRKLGITYTQYLVLLVLWEEDHLPINTIARKLMLGINTMSPLVKRMESLGLIARKASKEDKRVQYISLTQKGKKMKTEAAEIPGCLSACMIDSGLDLDELSAMCPTLDKLIARMESK